MNRVTKRLLPRVLALLVCLAASGSGLAQNPQVEVMEETAEHRVIRHAGGETRVPANPQRIVTLFNHLTEGLLALDRQPIGTVTLEGSFVGYLAPLLEGTEHVGTIPEPNLEAILALAPDLILGGPSHADIYGQLSRIAPTILVPEDIFTAEQTLVDLGAVLGLEAEARARVAAFKQTIADARTRLEARLGEVSAVYLSARPEGYRISSSSHSSGKLLHELGFQTDPLAPAEGFTMLSLETVPQLSADYIFLSEDDPERAEELRSSSLYGRIPAVQAGHVYTVDRELWLLGHSGVIGAEMIVGDVLEFVLGESE